MSKYNGDPDWDGCQAWNSPNAYSQHLQKQIATLRAALDRAEAEKVSLNSMLAREQTAHELALRQRDRHAELADQFEVEATTLRAELAAVRGVLEWYADQNNWKWSNGRGFYASEVHMIMSDQGHKARAALQSHRRTKT